MPSHRSRCEFSNAVARTLSLLHSIQASGLVANDDGEPRLLLSVQFALKHYLQKSRVS
jgi:hypothetical protein